MKEGIPKHHDSTPDPRPELDLAAIAESAMTEEEKLELVEGPAFKVGEQLPLKDGRKFKIESVRNTYVVTLVGADGNATNRFRVGEEELIKAVNDPARLEIWKPVNIMSENTLVTMIDTGLVCEVLKHTPNGDLLLFNPKEPTIPIRTNVDAVAIMNVPDGRGGQRPATREDRLKAEKEEEDKEVRFVRN